MDPSMYAQDDEFSGDVYRELDRVVRPDLHYHYSGPICAHRWLAVCQDPDYGHGRLLQRVERVFADAVAALSSDSGGLSKIELISLGTGDGSLDERILHMLSRRMAVASYCGLDFSIELLRRAVHRIAGAHGSNRRFPITAICGDFTGLESTLPDCASGGSVRLFTLTGLTMGNYRESELLTRVGELMHDGDYLFVDARLHSLGADVDTHHVSPSTRQEILRSYDLPSVRRFVFGPAEVATFATATDVEIDYEITGAVTSVPSALNVAIYCTGLNTTMRFTGQPVERDRLDLAVTTMYNYPDLVSWFGTVGFSMVWHYDASGIALLLLRKG
jgi:hypothetical protein